MRFFSLFPRNKNKEKEISQKILLEIIKKKKQEKKYRK